MEIKCRIVVFSTGRFITPEFDGADSSHRSLMEADSSRRSLGEGGGGGIRTHKSLAGRRFSRPVP